MSSPKATLRRNAGPQQHRSGAVLVELALTLPILFLLMAALIELSRVMLIKNTADTAAYEGARAGIVVGASPQTCEDAAASLLQATRMKSWCIDVEPEVFDENTPKVTVSVTLPVAANSWISPFFFKQMDVTSTVTLVCERPSSVQLTGIPKVKVKKASGLGVAVPLP